jgi:tetratricopeptide (TPR) repeat protein
LHIFKLPLYNSSQWKFSREINGHKSSMILNETATRPFLLLLLQLSVASTSAASQGLNAQFSSPQYKEVVEEMRAGQYAKAERLMESLSSRQPSAESYGLLGYICESQEKLDEARKAYTNSLQIKSDYLFSKIRLGILHAKVKEYVECISRFEALQGQINDSPEALYYLCWAYLESGNSSKALETATKMERLGGESLLSVSRLLVWKELYSQSLPLLRTTVEQLPQSGKAHYLLSLALYKTGKQKEMWPHLEKAYGFDPTSVQVLLLYASGLIDRSNFSEAKKFLRKVRELQPHDPTAKYLWCQTLIGEAAYAEAVQNLKVLVGENSQEPDVHLLLLTAYRLNGDVEAAIEYALKVVEIFPKNLRVQLNAGIDLQLLGGLPEAESSLRKAVTLAQNDPESLAKARSGLATVLVKQGNDSAAAPLLEELIGSNKDDVSFRLELGDCYLRMNRYDDARRTVEEVISVAPRNKRAHLLLGKILTRLDQHDQARDHFKIFQELEDAESQSDKAPSASSQGSNL